MATKAGVGFSQETDSIAAGEHAAREALRTADLDECDLTIIGCTGRHDAAGFLKGVRSVVGPAARIFGGSSMGVITNDRLGYEGYEAGVAALSLDNVEIDLFMETGLAGNEFATGAELGRKIAGNGRDDANLLLAYDSVRKTVPDGGPVLNLATPLLRGLEEGLEAWPRTAGMGVLADAQLVHPAFQVVDDRIERQSALGLVLSGNVRMDTLILHGCRPASPYHVITKAEGNVVYEIDGKPALEMIGGLIGPEAEWEDFPFFVTLGVNKGEKFEPFKEEHYANRLCFAVDKERRALIMFEPDLETGDEVQLMRRSIGFDYIKERISAFFDQIDGRDPFFALYIDCAGRAAPLCGMDQEEAAEVQRNLGDIPLLGMYTGVEIAELAGDVRALDWTGVLCVFSQA